MRNRPSFDRSRRAQAQVLGFALIFALAMTALTLYQVNVVPDRNEAVEFEHTGAVASDLTSLGGELRDASAAGSASSTDVRLGLTYPERTFGVNAPAPPGRLATTASRPITIENAVAGGEAADYWDGTPRQVQSRYVRYAPAYNYRDTDPVFRIEAGIVARQTDDGSVLESSIGPVTGDRIEIPTVAGEYSESGQFRSVDVQPVAGASDYRSVTDDGDPITLTVPTDLPASVWRQALADEPRVRSLDHRGDEVVIELEPDRTYRFRVPRSSLGGTEETDARYLTGERTERIIPEDSVELLTVTARDRYGNPVTGADVASPVVVGGSVRESPVTTDENGEATFRFEPDSGSDTARVVTQVGVGSDERRVVFDIDVADGGEGNGTGAVETTAGLGGRTDFQERQRLTVAKTEGRWENVDSFDQLLLSEGRFRRSDPTTNTVAMTLNFYIQDPDTGDYRTVNVELKPPSGPGGEWQSKKVKIEGPDRTYVNDAVLTDEAADRIVERNGRTGQVDLLDNANYEPRAAGPPVSEADRVAITRVASSNSFIYFRSMEQGIVDVEIR